MSQPLDNPLPAASPPAAPVALPQVPRWQSLVRSVALAANPIASLDSVLAQHGDTLQLYIGGVHRTVLTRDPGLVQHVLQKNHRNYAKSDFTRGFSRYVGHGLLTNDGPDWLRQRRLIQPGFHRQRVAGLTGLMQGLVAAELAPLRARALAQGGAVTVQAHALMTRLTFRIIARAVFSTAFADAELDRLSGLLTEVQAFHVGTIRQPYLRPWRWLRGRFAYHDGLVRELRTLLGGYIARRQTAGANAAAAPPDDLLQMLLDARYEDTGQPMTTEQVLDEALILLVAGHETSANALTWGLYLLARHPAEQAVIQTERAAAGLAATAPAFDDLPRLGTALHAVQEAMRLYPPAWMVDRVALADDNYQGLPIPKGTLFSLYLHGLHHAPQHWDAPEDFRPARFAPGAARALVPFAYAPFGGGPRLCVGMQFALTEMQLVVLEVLRQFALEWPAGQAPVQRQPLITLRPKGDFTLTLTLRSMRNEE